MLVAANESIKRFTKMKNPLPIRQLVIKARRTRINQTIEQIGVNYMAASYTQSEVKKRNLERMVEALKLMPMTANEIAIAIGVSDSTARAYVLLVPDIRVIKYVPTDRTYASVYALEGDEISLEDYLEVSGLAKEVEARRKARMIESNRKRDQKRLIQKMMNQFIEGVPQRVRDSFSQNNCSVVVFEGKKYTRESNHG